MPIANSVKRPAIVACSTCSGSAMKPNGVQPFDRTTAITKKPAKPIAAMAPASVAKSVIQFRRVNAAPRFTSRSTIAAIAAKTSGASA
jgi:hypothetical protein